MNSSPPADVQFANLNGRRVHYRSVGSGPTPVIFLSGWGCDTSLWVNQAPVLAPHYRVLLIDLPGHGGSDKPDIPYSIDLFLGAVNAVVEQVQAPKVVAVGHSLGGMVAYEYARRWPEKIVALIWVDAAFSMPIDVDQQIAGLRKRAEEFRSPDYEAKVRSFVDQLYVPETPTAIRETVTESILSTPQHVLASCMEGLADPRLFQHETLDIPAFAIFSAFWNPERFVDLIKKTLPRLQYELLTGVGHYPMLEKPEQVNAALGRFLATLSPCEGPIMEIRLICPGSKPSNRMRRRGN
jgi:pimeloyl-ACP methyl ester carboxylesterase